jgi:TetR/AcrR family transcriptional repressor of nem operon
MSKAEKTKQFIIETAANIFNEKGIAGTSVDDILQATKIAKGCLYGHFKSKEALSYASVDYLLSKLVERRTVALNKEVTATGKLYAFMDNSKNPLETPFEGGCPIVNLSTEADDTNPVIKQKIKSLLENAISLFTEILKDGILKGEFTDNLDPEEYAIKMFMSIEGANAICRVLNSVKPMSIIIKSLKKELATYRSISE